ncbi:hypothetical protein INS49_011221 [Diaporthe citri]|uniref:uncharacterized protein n=1 Tax=Diaporthe citri TaxID=83186 RepID=UPI001C7FEEF0|nr:uncharacterized protein INS49_011221 [Diaporthe citri]KAG6360165.1 hypothetical protein INS49_011221 [Diaporthe citri]
MGPGRLPFMRPLMASGLQLQARAASPAVPTGWIRRRCMSQQPTDSSKQQQPAAAVAASPELSQPSIGEETNRAQEPHPSPSHPQQSPESPDLTSIFANPTWSVRSLLPSSPPSADEVTPATLHHLLRLSALPPPGQRGEEDRMLGTLRAQLHFVRDAQSVDTRGVEPLRSIRDETATGVAESTVTLDTLREALSRETAVGFRRRPRRVKDAQERVQSEEERLVEAATVERRDKRYFVVASGKGAEKGE